MKYCIIGNGAAGMAAAEAVRDRDADGEIVIYTDEDRFHYSRPRIIEYLGGSIDPEKLTIRNENYYERKRIRLVKPVVVEAIDAAGKMLTLQGGRRDAFDRLIIASGASSFLPPVDGRDLDGVFTLRTIDDARRILASCGNGRRAAIVGGGLLGIETASALSRRGLKATVVEVFDRLLPRQLDAEGGAMLQSMLEAKGLRFLLGKRISAIRKRMDALELSFGDGSSFEVDIVVFSAGILPNVGVALTAGLACGQGILVDGRMETNVPGIFAAGDVAQFEGRVYGLWPAAREQGGFAGRNAAGANEAYQGSLVSATLKVSGIELASIGSVEAGDGVSVTTSRGEGSFKRLCVKDGRLEGAMLIGDIAAFQALQKIMKSRERVDDPDALF
jgi:nitrite reductase (NADH) large subunit